ncbi:DUF726-domain-containing protein [Rhizodiscina lignyota]|uniref:DUF726-domain-containing protein n=1 Tax=Rhizodiscina lignyota TaxID=1504668 RepID=A0A9P4ID35_9PEZI|nr:DUF726-domain-containing protein [Rhizodiscina lignyota]
MLSKVKAKAQAQFSSQDADKQEDGDSLTTVLETQEERGELTLLIANITESMRQTITDAFDPKQTGHKADQYSSMSAQENFENANLDVGQVDVEAEVKKRQEEEKRAKELSAPAMTELKDSALRYFDDWRDSVLLRIGEVVNARSEAQESKKRAKATSHSRSGSLDQSIPTLDKQDHEVSRVIQELYPPVKTPLTSYPEEKRALVLYSMLLLLLSLEHYAAHSRILLLYLTSSLNLPIDFLTEDEKNISRALLAAVEQMSADDETKKRAEANASSRKWKVGLAAVGGAALLAVTGGLAAPLLAAGVGTVMGGLGLGATAAAGYLGTLAGSTVLVGGLFGAYGGRMTSKMMDKYAREVEDFAFVPIRDFHRPRKIEKEYRRLRVAIGISGWLTDKDEVVKPWRIIAPSIEGFALRWELESLLKLGNSLSTMVRSAAWGVARTQIIKQTVFGALAAGLWPLALVKVSRIIDNPFSVAKARAEKAGEVLADALINKAQGERPVTLIGYSLGARVIYSCLMALAQRKAFGLVESVVLLGAPVPSSSGDWRKIRAVASGRVVNVFSRNDYILGFLYRTSSIQYGIAGLQEVAGVKGVQNVDVSEMVAGHTMYRYVTGSILKKIGFEDVYAEEVVREEQELKEMQRQEEEARKKNENAKKQKNGEAGKENEKDDADEEEVKVMEQEVEQKQKESMMAWMTEKFRLSRDTVGNTWSSVTGSGKRSSMNSGKGGAGAYEGT